MLNIYISNIYYDLFIPKNKKKPPFLKKISKKLEEEGGLKLYQLIKLIRS